MGQPASQESISASVHSPWQGCPRRCSGLQTVPAHVAGDQSGVPPLPPGIAENNRVTMARFAANLRLVRLLLESSVS
jgi:hypothetical protein